MESSENNTSSSSRGTSRPSLFNGATTETAPSILGALEKDARIPGSESARQTYSRQKFGFIALAVLAVTGTGIYLASAPSSSALYRQEITSNAAETRVAAAAAPASAEMATITSAQIESLSPPLIAPVGTVPSHNPLDKLAPKAAETAPALSSHSSTHAKTTAARAKPHPHAAPAAKKAHNTSTKASTTAARKPLQEEDADSDMVAAIMARLDHAAPAAGPATAVRTTKELAAPRPTSIADLIQNCAAMTDAMASRQCMNRICSNYWGKAEACPGTQ